jgi:hypothetical protein
VKPTRIISLVAYLVVATAAGVVYGVWLVSHGHALPVAHGGSLVTLPAIGVGLGAIAIPVFRYRRGLAARSKALQNPGASAPLAAGAAAPKRLDPFYAVRVLLLSKSVAIALSLIAGFNLGLVALQLSTPVIAGAVANNLLAAAGALFSVVVAVIVERACRIPEDGAGTQSSEATA